MKNENATRRELFTQAGRLAAGLGMFGALDLKPVFGAENGRAAHDYVEHSAEELAAPKGQDRTTVALIGCGGQGTANLREFMNQPGVHIAAVCDPDSGRMAQVAARVENAQDKAPDQLKDFRKVLERKDIDAVIVATPDHWHALCTIEAIRAGKDVFCEKPISHNIVEGRRMVDFATHHKKIVQVGTWQRSLQQFIDAVEYVRSGKLGKINVCRAWKIQAPNAAVMGHQQPTTPPANLDYDLWTGPAELLPYQENRCHYRFRWYYNYAAGMVGDWGVHMMDTVLLGMSKSTDLVQPTKVMSLGGKFYVSPDDDRTTPDTLITLYEFPGWLMQWEVHVGDQAVGLEGGRDHGALFIGSEGRVLVDRSGWSIFDAKGKPVEKPASVNLGSRMNGLGSHVAEFLANRRTGQQTRSNIASMHQTTTVCHLANLAYLYSGVLHWDPATEKVTNDKKAMQLLPYQRTYRKPWVLPKL